MGNQNWDKAGEHIDPSHTNFWCYALIIHNINICGIPSMVSKDVVPFSNSFTISRLSSALLSSILRRTLIYALRGKRTSRAEHSKHFLRGDKKCLSLAVVRFLDVRLLLAFPLLQLFGLLNASPLHSMIDIGKRDELIACFGRKKLRTLPNIRSAKNHKIKSL